MKNFIFFFIVFFIFTAYGQKEIIPTEQIKSWEKKAKSLMNVNNDSVIYYAKKIQQNTSDPCYQFTALQYEATATYNQRELKKAKKICVSILEQVEKKKNTLSKECYFSTKRNAHFRLAYTEKWLGNFQSTLQHLKEYEKTFFDQKPKKNEHMNTSLALLYGQVYYELYQFEKAFYNYQKSLNLAKKQLPEGDRKKLTLARIYASITSTYVRMYLKNKESIYLIDSAEINHKRGYDIAITINNQKDYTQKLNYYTKGAIYTIKKEYEKALTSFKKAQKIQLSNKQVFAEQLITAHVSNCFDHLNQQDSAAFYAKRFIENDKSHSSLKISLIKMYDILARYYDVQNDHIKAYQYSSLALKEIDTLNSAHTKGMQILSTIDISEVKASHQALLAKKTQHILYSKIVILILVVILLLIFWWSYRRNKKLKIAYHNLVEKTNNKKNLTFQKTESPGVKDLIARNILTGLDRLESEKAFLNSNYSLSYVAKALDTNISYVSRVINQYKDQTFHEYTNQLRIHYIVQELQDNPKVRKYSIHAIAKDIGYAEAASFSRIFKRITGMNPSYFIKKLKEEE